MKKRLLLFAIILIGYYSKAQSTDHLISDLHLLLTSAKTNFETQTGDKYKDDSNSKTVYYYSKMSTEGAKSIIIKMPDKNTFNYSYAIIYDIRAAGAVDKVLPVVMAYTEEFELMSKSGNYTVEQNEETNLTKIMDKKGNIVLEYIWNIEFVSLYIYSSPKTS